MRSGEIDRFFTLLSKTIHFPVKIILTGGAVAVLEGSARVTRDLDFQIGFSTRSSKNRHAFQDAIERTSLSMGIAAQYDEAIENWSSISWPKYRQLSRLYKRFGKVEVHLLDPILWSIGKLTRYLSSDIDDLVMVLQRVPLSPEEAVRAWGQALGKSPASSVQPLYKRQVLDFLRTQGPAIWGKKLNFAALESLFLESARAVRRR